MTPSPRDARAERPEPRRDPGLARGRRRDRPARRPGRAAAQTPSATRSAATPESLREDLGASAPAASALVLALAIAHSVIWYPAEILNAAAGYIYGFWARAAADDGRLADQRAHLLLHRPYAARPALLSFLGEERFSATRRVVEPGGDAAARDAADPDRPVQPLLLRRRLRRGPALALRLDDVVGYLPITALFIYLGSRLEELSLNDPFIWLGAVTLIAMLWWRGRSCRDSGSRRSNSEARGPSARHRRARPSTSNSPRSVPSDREPAALVEPAGARVRDSVPEARACGRRGAAPRQRPHRRGCGRLPDSRWPGSTARPTMSSTCLRAWQVDQAVRAARSRPAFRSRTATRTSSGAVPSPRNAGFVAEGEEGEEMPGHPGRGIDREQGRIVRRLAVPDLDRFVRHVYKISFRVQLRDSKPSSVKGEPMEAATSQSLDPPLTATWSDPEALPLAARADRAADPVHRLGPLRGRPASGSPGGSGRSSSSGSSRSSTR